MSRLTEIVNNTKIATGVILSGNLADDLATYFPAKEFGCSGEENDFARYFMENWGVEGGLLLHSLICLSIIFPVAYGVNKFFNEVLGLSIKPRTWFLYSMGGLSLWGVKNTLEGYLF